MDCEPRPIIVKFQDRCTVLPGDEFEPTILYQVNPHCDVIPMLHVCHLPSVMAFRQYSLGFLYNIVYSVYFDPFKDYFIMEGNRPWVSFVYHGITYEGSINKRSSKRTMGPARIYRYMQI